jgi:hypothetical protein
MEAPLEGLGVEVTILLKWISQELYKSLERLYQDQPRDEWWTL